MPINSSQKSPDNPIQPGGTLTFSITFDHPVKVWALQMGGWLPLPFCTAPMLLVDRNVTSALMAIRDNPNLPGTDAQRWWLDFINSEQFTVNPLLCAMEGKTRSVPTLAEFRQAFEEASQVLALGLPRTRLVTYTDVHFNAVFDTITRLAERYSSEVKFLLQVVSMIVDRQPMVNLAKIEHDIFNAACLNRLRPQSLVVVAVLSCLYEPQDGSEPRIGRGVLRPSKFFTEQDAHNALSDLRALEMLAAVNALSGVNAALCTRDKYLAAFWCELAIRNPKYVDDSACFVAKPSNQLFPRMSESEFAKLVQRLQDGS